MRFLVAKRLLLSFALVVATAAIASCSASKPTDPLAALSTKPSAPSRHIAAMEILDTAPVDEAYLLVLHRMMWDVGYSLEAREAALQRLLRHDVDNLKVTIRRRLPNMASPQWADRLCRLIADEHWKDLTPGLISRLATVSITDDKHRASYQALVALHGDGSVADVTFNMLVESSDNQFLRIRCWHLLHRLGLRQRLYDLMTDEPIDMDDLFLADLQRGVFELGVLPHNQYEILWLRKLLMPENAEFWSQAQQALGQVRAETRRELQLRDIPIVVSAWLHQPDLLQASRDVLYDVLRERLQSGAYHARSDGRDVHRSGLSEQLFVHRDDLTWGDLAAMHMALRAVREPAIVSHLFNYADRDHNDESTEYGGIVALDSNGRFELLEFPPRNRLGDYRFLATQEMFDRGYTALFHFHLHAQEYSNRRYAGPGSGDLKYANEERANCLVFTFVERDALNMDYYRHDNVIVDLGVVHRP